MLSRENLKHVVVLVCALLVGWTGPSIAHGVHAKFAHNADKVDGKHAVGAGAGLTHAKGRLVAHNNQGKLPARFLPKVKDADKLDGRDSTSFRSKLAGSGEIQTGVYGAGGGAQGGDSYFGAAVTFPSRLPTALGAGRVTFIERFGPPTAECPGPGKVAVNGWLCIYEQWRVNRSYDTTVNPATHSAGSSADGFVVFFTPTDEPAMSYGVWAVRAAGRASLR